MKKKILFLMLFILSFSLVSSWYRTNPVVVYSKGINCEVETNFSRWLNLTANVDGTLSIVNSYIVFNSSGNVGNCSLFTNPNIFNGTCCPIGYYCNLSTSICVRQITPPKNYCLGLDREQCEGGNRFTFGNLTFFELKVPGWEKCGKDTAVSNSCSNYTFCECYWSSGNCSFRRRDVQACFNVLTGQQTSYTEEKCEYFLSSKEDKCAESGKVVVNYGAQKIPTTASISCQGFSRDYPCSTVVTLPFFSFFNLLLSVLVIGIVYFFFSRK